MSGMGVMTSEQDCEPCPPGTFCPIGSLETTPCAGAAVEAWGSGETTNDGAFCTSGTEVVPPGQRLRVECPSRPLPSRYQACASCTRAALLLGSVQTAWKRSVLNCSRPVERAYAGEAASSSLPPPPLLPPLPPLPCMPTAADALSVLCASALEATRRWAHASLLGLISKPASRASTCKEDGVSRDQQQATVQIFMQGADRAAS